MGHRLTKITTRTGDDGTTGLAGGERVQKDSLRIRTLGQVDELNCCVGLLLAEEPPVDVADALQELQQRLFDLGAELSMRDSAVIAAEHVSDIEATAARFNEGLPPLREFVLPGGGRAAALCHLARAVCRRAECSLIALGRVEAVNEVSQVFLNRASDLLFVLARVLARQSGQAEALWRGLRAPGKVNG